MKKIVLLLLIPLFFLACKGFTSEKKKHHKKDEEKNSKEVIGGNDNCKVITQFPKKLKEISGIVKDGNFLWAISDNPEADIYKLDLSGQVVQQLHLKNITVNDVEDITADADYLYIGDLGDNDGRPHVRQIIKIKKSSIGTQEKTEADGEVISFSFPGQGDMLKKKHNEYDCESIISFKDALYVFTKRRNDNQTELFMLSKTAGKQTPKSIALFNSKGLITGAALNAANNEVSLVGYQSGHLHPFIWTLSDFKGNNFFSGKQTEYILAKDEKDWQVESVTYKDDATLFFACEQTKEVPAQLYTIDKKLIK